MIAFLQAPVGRVEKEMASREVAAPSNHPLPSLLFFPRVSHFPLIYLLVFLRRERLGCGLVSRGLSRLTFI